ncbi:chorismate synthase [Marssonina coronariae]|uniref:Chorismate synthase n=1 Tax=Diplocarpon coronariae TaxID=2795749 RepID=A0A218YVJ3_9HELO|nr:chorismate synthase [Marssonina coronariae]
MQDSSVTTLSETGAFLPGKYRKSQQDSRNVTAFYYDTTSRRSTRPRRTIRNTPIHISGDDKTTLLGEAPGLALSIDDISPRPKKRIRTRAKLKKYVVSASDNGSSDGGKLPAGSSQVQFAVSSLAESMRSSVDCAIETAVKEMAAAKRSEDAQ